jgi:hypothetical protein
MHRGAFGWGGEQRHLREALKKVAAATRCASVQCMPGEAGNAHIAVLVHEDDAPRQRPTEMDGFRVEYYSVEPR